MRQARLTCLALLLLSVLISPRQVRADGFLMDKLGVYIPETRQTAFIEWKHGQERLYVSTGAAASEGPTLFIIPVPTDAERVQAEPVEKFPYVAYKHSAVRDAQNVLREIRMLTLLLDTGFLACPFYMLDLGNRVGATFDQPQAGLDQGVKVYQHVEKLGMVVEVLTAESTEALDSYLAANHVETRAASIRALEPYLGSEYALVCGWAASAATDLQARSLRIDFPSAKAYYPMRPTSVYESPIETSIYLGGFFKLQGQAAIPGLECRYLYGRVAALAVGEKVSPDYLLTLPDERKGVEAGDWAPLTEVRVGGLPKDWTHDLWLVPGAPAAVALAKWLETSARYALPVLVGVILAAFLPWLVFPRSDVRGRDVLWALGVGVATIASIYASAGVFHFWCKARRSANSPETPTSDPKPRRGPGFRRKAVLVFAISALLLGVMFALGGPEAAGVVLIVVVLAGWTAMCGGLLSLIASAQRGQAGSRAGWFVAFAGLHLAASWGVCYALEIWLGRY